MPEFITLSCPSCGGKLKITNDIDRFACAHCGTEYIVNRGEGIVSLSPVIEEIKRVRKATDLTATELAIARLEREIDELIKFRDSKSVNKFRSSYYMLIVFGSLLIMLSVMIGGGVNGSLYCTIPLILGLICLTIGISLGIKETTASREQINQEITQKQIELNKHKNKVRFN